MRKIDFNEIKQLENTLAEYKITCKCGTKTVMSSKTDRCICRGCKCWLYRTKELEFRYRLKEKMYENKSNGSI